MPELTILMPCLNESETLAACIDEAQGFFSSRAVDGEVLIADNGSTDGSVEIALEKGCRVVHVERRGYGAALQEGIRNASGKYVIMGDADLSYDFEHLDAFLEALRGGCQLVMGNRFKGGIQPGAMPFLHKYLGNPVLSFIGRLFFKSPVGDFHCGLRGFDREAITDLDLKSDGMEFASEMVVKASVKGYRLQEVPTVLRPDGRTRAPHLRTWRDGWRHLRFLLLFSPRWLFLYPGLLMFLVGLAGMLLIINGDFYIQKVGFGIHTLLFMALTETMGLQLIYFGLIARKYAENEGLVPRKPMIAFLTSRNFLEWGILGGLILVIAGFIWTLLLFFDWEQANFGYMSPDVLMRSAIPAGALIYTGVQTIFSSFLLVFVNRKDE